MIACKSCGREPENGAPTHWLGCAEGAQTPLPRAQESPSADQCEREGCSQSKKEYSGRGAKPKYCEEHSDPKNRK